MKAALSLSIHALLEWFKSLCRGLYIPFFVCDTRIMQPVASNNAKKQGDMILAKEAVKKPLRRLTISQLRDAVLAYFATLREGDNITVTSKKGRMILSLHDARKLAFSARTTRGGRVVLNDGRRELTLAGPPIYEAYVASKKLAIAA